MTSRHLMILLTLCSGMTYPGPQDPPADGPTNQAARHHPGYLFTALLALLVTLLWLVPPLGPGRCR